LKSLKKEKQSKTGYVSKCRVWAYPLEKGRALKEKGRHGQKKEGVQRETLLPAKKKKTERYKQKKTERKATERTW